MDNAIKNIFTGMVEKSKAINDDVADSSKDYRNAEGFLMCGTCNTPRECRVKIFGIVPCVCDCAKAKRDAEREAMEAEQRRLHIKDLMRRGITDPSYANHIFDHDDRANPEASDICRRYCEFWGEMRKDNTGLLFYGGVGTGKSFLACCIASELLSHCVPVCVTNLPTLIKKTSSFNTYDLIEELSEYELLIIDDLGVERDSAFSLEQTYAIIDARYRTGKPLIVTTNLSPAELKNPDTDGKKRIYDRVNEMCSVPIKMTGKPRRLDIAAEKREKAQRLLRNDKI